MGDFVPFLIALVLGLAIMPLAAWAGLAVGIVDRPSGAELKIHHRAVPVVGGFVVIASVLASLAVLDRGPSLALAGATILALVTGFLDDLRPLGPALRIALLVVAGVILITGGARLGVLGPFAAAGVVLLVLACSNAVNLIDGQDGLAGGVALFAGLGLAIVGSSGPRPIPPLAFALGGALLGFLAWNRPPAKVFLGNGGAYGIGALLAALATSASFHNGWRALLGSAVCLGVLAFELLFTVARRLPSGGGLATGDRSHSYDLVAARLGSRARATAVFWGLAAAAAALGAVIGKVSIAVGGPLAAAWAIAMAIWGRQLWASRGSTPSDHEAADAAS